MEQEKITCPACRAVISSDGETVFTDSPRITTASQLTRELVSANKKIDALTARVEELTKKPTAAAKKGFADDFFD